MNSHYIHCLITANTLAITCYCILLLIKADVGVFRKHTFTEHLQKYSLKKSFESSWWYSTHLKIISQIGSLTSPGIGMNNQKNQTTT